LRLRSVTLGNIPDLDHEEVLRLCCLPALAEVGLTGVKHLLDEKLATVLCKLAPRSLKLTAVRVTAGGLSTLCTMPRVEDLVLWHCLHLERCDLTALAKLRSLRSLALCGVGWSMASALEAENPLPGEPARPSSATPGLAPSEPPRALLTAELMRGLAPLPELRELDLSSSVLTGELLAALPRRLHRLALRECSVDRPDALARVQLPELRALACSVLRTFPESGPDDFLLQQAELVALLDRQPLRELKFVGTVTDSIAASLGRQMALEELEFQNTSHKDSLPLDVFASLPKLRRLRLMFVTENADPAPLAKLPALTRVELHEPHATALAAFRKVLGDRVVVLGPDY
jgi:hypothetical protein